MVYLIEETNNIKKEISIKEAKNLLNGFSILCTYFTIENNKIMYLSIGNGVSQIDITEGINEFKYIIEKHYLITFNARKLLAALYKIKIYATFVYDILTVERLLYPFQFEEYYTKKEILKRYIKSINSDSYIDIMKEQIKVSKEKEGNYNVKSKIKCDVIPILSYCDMFGLKINPELLEKLEMKIDEIYE